MKGSTLFGILLGLAAILGSFFFEGGTPDMLFLIPGMTIVIVGTLAAGIAGHDFAMIKRLPRLFKIAFNPPVYDFKEILEQIIQYAAIARRDGILALEGKLKNAKHPYLKKFFEICIDGATPDTFNRIANNEIHYISERHMVNIGFFNKLGGYSPTMGIIGTVMGLILSFASVGSDPNILIRHIGTAFIATLWGILMANIVWLPMGDKLRTIHDNEINLLQMMLDGVEAVQSGETPTVIRARLISAFPLEEQEQIYKGRKIYNIPPPDKITDSGNSIVDNTIKKQ
ncbi:MAG: MotA/TolQ/ExbB proton channel family protein [Desulfobulbaceae bacterium]|nr:MotA/TolQ/ExbB proton channel family protein [Desulfobulbaceae bacterium]